MSEERENDAMAELEAALGSLTPTASSLQRDRLMFLAGQASVGRSLHSRSRWFSGWLWPCATAVSLLVAIAFGGLRTNGSKPEIVDRVVYLPPAVSSAASESFLTESQLSSMSKAIYLRQLVLEKGVDAMSELPFTPKHHAPTSPRADTNRQLLYQFLNDPTT